MMFEKEFTIMRESVIGGVTHYQQFKGCKILLNKANCQCGFRRLKHNGFLDKRQVKDIKQHIANTEHSINITMDWNAREKHEI